MNISQKLKDEIMKNSCIQRFKKALEEKIDYRELELSERTVWDYLYEVYLVYKQTGIPIDQDLTLQQCKQWRRDKIDDYGRKTMAKKIPPINHYLHLCCGYPEKAIAQVKNISRAKTPVILSGEQIFGMVDFAESKKKYTEAMMIFTGFVTACRRSVLPTIRISDIKDRGKESTITLRKCKGDKDLHVPVSEPDMQRIQHYIQHHRPEPEKPEYEDFLFLLKKGTPASDQKLARVLQYCAREIGLKEAVHPHTLRHSRIKYCRTVLKMRAEAIIVITGHSKVSTLYESYMIEEDIDEVHKILNANNEQSTEPQQNTQSDLDKETAMMKSKIRLAEMEKENLHQAKTNLELRMQLKEELQSIQPLDADQKGYG